MGTTFSSRKDYNRVLAKQPRDPIIISKFELPEEIGQRPLVGTLSIPDPVRHLPPKEKAPSSLNAPAHSEPVQALVKPVEIKPSSSTHDNLTEKQVVTSDSPYSSRLSLQMYDEEMNNNNAIVVSRSVVNLNDQRRFHNSHLSSFRPNRTIVERNGKQFLTEFKERMEQRYVQVFDETTGRTRTFEVTDYIPSRTVRPMRSLSQFQPQSRIARYGLSQRPTFSTVSNRMPLLAMSSSLIGFNDLIDRHTVKSEFALHQNSAILPPNNMTPSAAPPSQTQLTTRASTDSGYNYPDPTSSHVYSPPIASSQHKNNPSTVSLPQAPNASAIASQLPNNSSTTAPQHPYNAPNVALRHTYNTSAVPPRHAYDQYSPRSYRSETTSFRPHSPTASTYSINNSAADSTNSQDESDAGSLQSRSNPYKKRVNNGRTDVNVSLRGASGNKSPETVDPFARPIRTSDHRYTRRPHTNQYSQPLSKKQGYQANSALDYTPISMAHNRSNQRQELHRDSDAYNG